MKSTLRFTLYLAVMIALVSSLFSALQMQPYHNAFAQAVLHPTSKWGSLLQFLAEALLMSFSTLLIVRWSLIGLIRRSADWIKNLRLSTPHEAPPLLSSSPLFEPLAIEVRHLANSLSAARAAAETEARLRQSRESLWTPERLKEHARSQLQQRSLVVVSNREPYMHIHKGKQIECVVPPSGLVTAIEPILRACSGTWIAHGSADADREVVDSNDKVRVPPEEPKYTLRRVWLTKEEEEGYYYGFANEGLWPLCHIAHARPLFRPGDWDQYQAVNARFAKAVIEELEGTEEPWVLIQDYHFALLPRLIKEARPDARVALFWHIPWPNPESFGICPWKKELIHGMLGADLLGFHIQYHCNHFLDTVDQTLESRVDRERFTVNRQGHTTWVKPFPISVAFTGSPSPGMTLNKHPDKAALLRGLGIQARFLGVGVDRIDYTKGIIERFLGIERFLEKYPQYVRQFTFVELGAPSRSLIKRYSDLIHEAEVEVERINRRFQTKEWKPIVFLKKQHSHKDIEPFYKAAEVCLVTSLHDGMNLVAKEFVAARDDGDGVLVLSSFTGASRELRGCLLINPYDINEIAEAIRAALEMDPANRTARMKQMRQIVRERNIYRWAANLIAELGHIPMRNTETTLV